MYIDIAVLKETQPHERRAAPRLKDSLLLGATSSAVNLRTRRSQQQQTKTEQLERQTRL
jgi:hypothetical protein